MNNKDGSGTTATVVILLEDRILSANVGDSGGFICCDETGDLIAITEDHRPSNEQERERIIAQGGFVSIEENKRPRVNGVLAVSRALGHSSEELRKALSSKPFTYSIPMKNHFKYIVIGTDGVWDYIQPRDVQEMISEFLDRSKLWFHEAAEYVVKQSYIRGSFDNIGLSIIPLTL